MYNIYYKTRLYVGKGALAHLGDYHNQSILVVADPFLKESGQLDLILEFLDASNDLVIFTDIVPDPPIDVIVAGIKATEGKSIDIVLSVGGGSAIDASKAMYYFAKKQGVFKDVELISIPTTSGTGSEVTSFAVITDAEKEQKYPIVDWDILPEVAILDSNLVETLPANITADTGMDVLTHAIEAYVSNKATDFSDALAEKAIKLVFEYLPRAYKDGHDLEAREKMHVASTLAGMAFNSASLGINHSIAHAAGAKFHIPHGRLNSILMPHIIQYNANVTTNGARTGNLNKETAERYQQIARLLGLSASTPVLGVRQLVDAVRKLQKKLDHPTSLSAYGVALEDFNENKREIAEAALVDKCTITNPRVPTVEELLKVVEQAF